MASAILNRVVTPPNNPALLKFKTQGTAPLLTPSFTGNQCAIASANLIPNDSSIAG